MSETNPQSEKEAKTIKYQAAPVELITSSIIGAVGGLISAAATIRKEFNKEVIHWPEAGRIIQSNKTALDALDNSFLGKSDQWREHAIAKRDLKNKHSEKFIREFLFKEHGLETEGAVEGASIWKNIKMAVYGTYQRHEHLGTSNRRLDVWYKAIAVTTILGVGAYNLLTSIATRKKARQIEDLLIDRVLKAPDAGTTAVQSHEAQHHSAKNHVSDVKHESRVTETAPEASRQA